MRRTAGEPDIAGPAVEERLCLVAGQRANRGAMPKTGTVSLKITAEDVTQLMVYTEFDCVAGLDYTASTDRKSVV